MTHLVPLEGTTPVSLTLPEWRPVVGYEGVYEVTAGGVVKRVGRVKGAELGYVLKWQPSTTGYPAVYLSLKNKTIRRYVHIVVAEAFICPRPKGKEVNHIDSNRANPHVSNLEWVTRAENVAHMQRVGNANYAVGERASKSKLTEAQVREIRAATGTLQAIADVYGLHHTTVRSIRLREYWKHVA